MATCRRIAIPPGEPIDLSSHNSLEARMMRQLTGFFPAQPAQPLGETDEHTGEFLSYGGYNPRLCGGWYEMGRSAYQLGKRCPPSNLHFTARAWWKAGNRAAAIEAGKGRRR